MEAWSRPDTELAFGDVEPTALLWRGHTLQPVQQGAGLVGSKRLVQGRACMGVPMIPYQGDALRHRKILLDPPPHSRCPWPGCLMVRDINSAPPNPWGIEQDQKGHPRAFGCHLVAFHLTRLAGNHRTDCLPAWPAGFLQTDHRIIRVLGSLIGGYQKSILKCLAENPFFRATRLIPNPFPPPGPDALVPPAAKAPVGVLPVAVIRWLGLQHRYRDKDLRTRQCACWNKGVGPKSTEILAAQAETDGVSESIHIIWSRCFRVMDSESLHVAGCLLGHSSPSWPTVTSIKSMRRSAMNPSDWQLRFNTSCVTLMGNQGTLQGLH